MKGGDVFLRNERCRNCIAQGYADTTCVNFRKCPFMDGLQIHNAIKINTIINNYTDFTEIVFYKSVFAIPDSTVVSDVDRSRKFIRDENNVLIPRDNTVSFEDYNITMFDSAKRAKDNFYGFALANNWHYFLTLTFDPKKVDRNDEIALRYCWKLFRQKLQYISKNVKILCVPERHPSSGKIHFHALIGDIDLSDKLSNAVNVKTGEKLKSKFGDTVYNIDLWEYGYSTCIDLLARGYDKCRVANYLIGYCTKENDIIGYNKKRYYRTRNLAFKNKVVTYMTKGELFDTVCDMSVQLVKDNEKFTVYRIDNALKKSLSGSVKEEVQESNIKIHNVSINGKNYMS